MTTPEVRIGPASGEDARGIVEVVRSGFDPALIELMIYGAPAAERFIRDQIAARGLGADTVYTVAAAAGEVVGCVEMRRLPDGLFLNYISVRPEARARGLGRALLRHALDPDGQGEAVSIRLDVLEHNWPARGWYDHLGFRREDATDWWELPPSPPPSSSAGPPAALLTGYPQAQACHERFGLSQFTVITPSGSHAVGRLGAAWFRLTRAEALTDPDLGRALNRIDPARRVLALLREGTLPAGVGPARRVAGTLRLAAEVDEVIRRLGG